jgi:hypothetical protein
MTDDLPGMHCSQLEAVLRHLFVSVELRTGECEHVLAACWLFL